MGKPGRQKDPKAQAAENILKEMTGPSGDVASISGMGGYVDDKGVLHFGKGPEPVMEPAPRDVGALRGAAGVGVLDDLRGQLEELAREEELSQEDDPAMAGSSRLTRAAREFGRDPDNKYIADAKARLRRQAAGAEGPMFYGTEVPAHNNPYLSRVVDTDGHTEGLKVYYLDEETGEPEVGFFSVSPWQSDDQDKDKMWRALEEVSRLVEDNSGYLSSDMVDEIRHMMMWTKPVHTK